MAQRKKSTSTSSRSRSRTKKSGTPIVSPATLRSIVAVVLLAAGAITLIALFLPSGGLLNGYVDGFLRPLFGQGAWLLGILLLVAGVLVERAPSVDYSWITVALGGLIVFVGGQGLIHLFSGKGGSATDLEQGGGALGYTLASTLSDLLSPAGAFVVLAGIVLVGLLLLFDITLVAFVTPFIDGGRAVAAMVATGAADTAGAVRDRRAARAHETATRAHEAVAIPIAGASRGRRRAAEPAPELPQPMPSPAPMSQTVWVGAGKRDKDPAADHGRRAVVGPGAPRGRDGGTRPRSSRGLAHRWSRLRGRGFIWCIPRRRRGWGRGSGVRQGSRPSRRCGGRSPAPAPEGMAASQCEPARPGHRIGRPGPSRS